MGASTCPGKYAPKRIAAGATCRRLADMKFPSAFNAKMRVCRVFYTIAAVGTIPGEKEV
jgi:hypothetical protein